MTMEHAIPTLSFTQPPNVLAEQLLHACTTTGFFYLSDLPIDEALIDGAWRASEALFLPTGEEANRQRLASRDRSAHTGYTALQEEKLDTSLNGPEKGENVSSGDLKESFYLARLSTVPHRQILPQLLNDEHRRTLDALFESCHSVCMHLLRLVAISLQLDGKDKSNYFASKHNAYDDRLRLLHYPPVTTHHRENAAAIRAGAHTDYGSLTLLFQRGVSGLQVLQSSSKNDGQIHWIDVAPPTSKTTIVVNVADALEFWTGGLFRSAQHRVAMPGVQKPNSNQSRFSMAYFCQPNADALLEPVRCSDTVLEATQAQRRSSSEYETELGRKGIRSARQTLTGGQHLQSRLQASYV